MKYQARPFREQIGSREIQRDIDLMRAIYDRRGPINRRRYSDLPWITLGMVIGVILAAIFYF